jgi:hypothetical protein
MALTIKNTEIRCFFLERISIMGILELFFYLLIFPTHIDAIKNPIEMNEKKPNIAKT